MKTNKQTDKNVDILTWSLWTGDIINRRQLPLPIYSQVWLFKLPTFVGSWKKTRKFQKNIYFCFIDYTKAFDYVDHSKLWKILKEIKTRLPYLSPEKPIWDQEAKVINLHWTTDWFKVENEVLQDCIFSPAYLSSKQSTSCEMLDWINHKLES